MADRPDSSDEQEGEATDDRLRSCDVQVANARPVADRSSGSAPIQPLTALARLLLRSQAGS